MPSQLASDNRRVNFIWDKDRFEALCKLADKEGVPYSELIRRAIYAVYAPEKMHLARLSKTKGMRLRRTKETSSDVPNDLISTAGILDESSAKPAQSSTAVGVGTCRDTAKVEVPSMGSEGESFTIVIRAAEMVIEIHGSKITPRE